MEVQLLSHRKSVTATQAKVRLLSPAHKTSHPCRAELPRGAHPPSSMTVACATPSSGFLQ